MLTWTQAYILNLIFCSAKISRWFSMLVICQYVTCIIHTRDATPAASVWWSTSCNSGWWCWRCFVVIDRGRVTTLDHLFYNIHTSYHPTMPEILLFFKIHDIFENYWDFVNLATIECICSIIIYYRQASGGKHWVYMMCYILQRGWWPEGWKAEARVVCNI